MYKINRNCICGGIVSIKGISTIKPKTTPFGILDGFTPNKEEIFLIKRRCELQTRAELFCIDTDNAFANDILFHTMPYKIEDFPYHADCKPNTPIMTHVVALPKLLEKLEYGKKISRLDLIRLLKRMTLDPTFLDDIAQFYGYEKNEQGIFIKKKKGVLDFDDFRKLREIQYVGEYLPASPEPNYLIARRKRL